MCRIHEVRIVLYCDQTSLLQAKAVCRENEGVTAVRRGNFDKDLASYVQLTRDIGSNAPLRVDPLIECRLKFAELEWLTHAVDEIRKTRIRAKSVEVQ